MCRRVGRKETDEKLPAAGLGKGEGWGMMVEGGGAQRTLQGNETTLCDLISNLYVNGCSHLIVTTALWCRYLI